MVSQLLGMGPSADGVTIIGNQSLIDCCNGSTGTVRSSTSNASGGFTISNPAANSGSNITVGSLAFNASGAFAVGNIAAGNESNRFFVTTVQSYILE